MKALAWRRYWRDAHEALDSGNYVMPDGLGDFVDAIIDLNSPLFNLEDLRGTVRSLDDASVIVSAALFRASRDVWRSWGADWAADGVWAIEEMLAEELEGRGYPQGENRRFTT